MRVECNRVIYQCSECSEWSEFSECSESKVRESDVWRVHRRDSEQRAAYRRGLLGRLYSTAPKYTLVYCTKIYCIILLCTVIHNTVLYCIVLSCTV